MDTYTIEMKTIKINDIEFYIPNKNSLDNLFEIVLIANNKKEIIPTVCIVKEITNEDYDYDFEDNLVYNGLNVEYVYIPIKFNPFNGKKFVFKSIKTYDKTKEYEELEEKICEIKSRRKSKSKTKDLFIAEQALNKLFDDIPKILYTNEILKEYDESILIPPIYLVENTDEFGNDLY